MSPMSTPQAGLGGSHCTLGHAQERKLPGPTLGTVGAQMAQLRGNCWSTHTGLPSLPLPRESASTLCFGRIAVGCRRCVQVTRLEHSYCTSVRPKNKRVQQAESHHQLPSEERPGSAGARDKAGARGTGASVPRPAEGATSGVAPGSSPAWRPRQPRRGHSMPLPHA